MYKPNAIDIPLNEETFMKLKEISNAWEIDMFDLVQNMIEMVYDNPKKYAETLNPLTHINR